MRPDNPQTETAQQKACRRGTRRWCLPPAILRDPCDKLEGDTILWEISDDLGLLLWHTVRDVALWAETPPRSRRRLFSDGSADRRVLLLTSSDVPPEVSASLHTVHGMLALSSRADAGILSVCCLEIAAYARRAGLPHTAIAFAQAGALASPQFAEPALHTGMSAAAAGQLARAETWLRRAVNLARREKDRAAHTSGLVELGRVYETRGDLLSAERLFRRAFRAGRRFGARSGRMGAAHGLFRLARLRGDNATAAQFALAAQGVYAAGADGAPAFLLDLARFWMELGEVARARAALRRLAPHRARLPMPGQLAAVALTARACAGPGTSREWAADSAATAWAIMPDPTIPDDVRFSAALDLAHAARGAGDEVAFTRAKRVVLTLAPQAIYPAVASEIAAVERAS